MKKKILQLPYYKASIRTTGNCFNGYLKNVENNLSIYEANKTRQDSIDVIQAAVQIVKNKYGKKGISALNNNARMRRKNTILPESSILVYGRVQSGKTNCAIGTLALALENGFKSFVYLTSDNLWLLDQTERRIEESLQDSRLLILRKEEWSDNPKKIALTRINPYINNQSFLFFCNKNVKSLDKLLTLLKNSHCYQFPSIIIDDEADNASLNTSTRAQVLNPNKTDSQVSALIKKIRTHLNNVFIQVTATPESLLLQHVNHPDKPYIPKLLEPGQGYMGGDLFFRTSPQHTDRTISDQEVDDIKSGNTKTPKGLQKAFISFCVAYADSSIKKIHRSGKYSFLAHICHKIPSQQALEKIIEKIKLNIYQTLLNKKGKQAKKELLLLIKDAYNNLKKTASLSKFSKIVNQIQNAISNLSVITINSTNKMREPNYKIGMNVLVGGNRLSRGVTIEGLITSYYGRSVKSPQSDTMHQHARMFGYRGHLKDVTRLFVPKTQYDYFLSISEAEAENRSSIENLVPNKNNIVWIGQGLRPTRSSVYDPTPHALVVGGVQRWPRYPTWKRKSVKGHNYKLQKYLSKITPGKNFFKIRLEEILRILKEMPSAHPQREHYYNLSAIEKVLRKSISSSTAPQFGYINFRIQGNSNLYNSEPWTKGYISGSGWADEARKLQVINPEMPVLIVYRIHGKKRPTCWDDEPVYLPTLWLPKNKLMAIYS